MDARHQFLTVKGLGQIIIRPAAQGLHLAVNLSATGENHDRRADSAVAQGAKDIESAHIRQVQIQEDQVVIIELAEIDTLLTHICGEDIEALRLENQLHTPGDRGVILNHQHAHGVYLRRGMGRYDV